jgi:hypothetical protein
VNPEEDPFDIAKEDRAASIPASRGDNTEGLLARAYLRGVEWRDENPGHVDYSYRFKAACDYADKTYHAHAASPAPQPVQEQEPVAWAPIADNGTIVLSSAQDERSELAGWEQDGWRVIPLYASPPEQGKYDAVVAGFDRLAATQNEIVHQITSRAEAAEAKVERLTEALRSIEAWKFPPTGKFWPNTDGSNTDSERTMSYGACYGSNGERDYMRSIARAALVKP